MTCGVDWWAVAAGRGPIRQGLTAGDADQEASTRTAGAWWSAVPVGQRLRIGLGIVGIALIAVYGLVDTPTGATGRHANEQAPPAAVADAVPPAAPSTPAAAGPASQPEVPQPAEAAASAPVATPASAPTPLPTTVVLEGSGSQVTQPFAYPGGSVRVLSMASTGAPAGCVYIGTFRSTDPAALPIDDSLLTAAIFLEGPGSGEGWVDLTLAPGSYLMEIESDCDWMVTVAPR